MKASLHVVYVDPGGLGYHCMYYMARLAAELLNGELVVLRPRNIAPLQKATTLLPRAQNGAQDGIDCLLICPYPAELSAILQIPGWRQKYRRLLAWVFDSFWTEHIPKLLRWTRVFDHVFVTEQEDLETWRSRVKAPVEWLPWGSDVLRLGSENPARHFDLLRFGRQPVQWDDDAATASDCAARGVVFQGRPPMLEDACDSQIALMNCLRNTKFALAFSNLVSPNPQTHPTREYLTGRWTDALASGATVAGVPPRSPSAQSLLWPEALLDLGTVHRDQGLEVIAGAVRDWTPERARENRLRSLERLDWRWRFKKVAEALGTDSDRLDQELGEVKALLHSGRVRGAAAPSL